MRVRLDEFACTVTLEMGKLINESRDEVRLSADILDYYAKNAECLGMQDDNPQPSRSTCLSRITKYKEKDHYSNEKVA
jgi:succinate-semialdehyde dehydrogenase/glutarate-semialdehyde dehydrogenase